MKGRHLPKNTNNRILKNRILNYLIFYEGRARWMKKRSFQIIFFSVSEMDLTSFAAVYDRHKLL